LTLNEIYDAINDWAGFPGRLGVQRGAAFSLRPLELPDPWA
jgi:hypothetical protein